ncbi:MAG: type 4a pilus biogenesis protein PilO [Francisellaceae bacterium]
MPRSRGSGCCLRLLVSLVVTAFGVLAGYGMFITTKLNEASRLIAVEEKQKSNYALNLKAIDMAPKLHEEISELAEQLSFELAGFKPLPETSVIIAQIAALAHSFELKVDMLSPQSKKERLTSLIVPITLDFKGSFHALLQFMQALQQLPYFIIVKRLNLSARGEKELSPELQVHLEFEALDGQTILSSQK